MSTKPPIHKLAVLAMSAVLTFSAGIPVWAADAPAVAREAIGTVSISDTASVELNQIHLTSSQEGKLAVVQIILHNGGPTSLKVVDYWLRLRNTAGSQFGAKLLPSDKSKTHVAPGSSTRITYYASVNEDTRLQDLSVEFIKWDLSQPRYERRLGLIQVPADYTDVTPAGAGAILQVGETDVLASVPKLIASKNEKYHVPTVYWKLENVGGHTVTMPEYTLSIRTPEGLLYPLEAKGLKGLEIKPRENKEIQLTGSIPIAVPQEQWELVVTQADPDLKINLHTGAFRLPEAASNPEGSLGQEYTFTSKEGVFQATMNAMYRLPWEDQDLLSAAVLLRNSGTNALTLPELTGYFLLDDSVKIEAKAVKSPGVVGLDSGASLGIHMVGKLPYSSKFSRVKLVLQEKESDTVTTDLLELTGGATMQDIPFHEDLSSAYTFGDAGRSTGIRIREFKQYASSTDGLVVAEVEATNLEPRYQAVPRLAAQFRTEDGTLIPAEVAEIKERISPKGKALLHVSAQVPQGVSTDNMQLLLGESVTAGQLTEGEGKTETYVNPASFLLPAENTGVKSSLKDVDLYPYHISMSGLSTVLENTTFTFQFDYELKREKQLPANMEGRKLILAFEDANGQKAFEKAFEMKDFDLLDGDAPDQAASRLKLGKHEEFKVKVEDQYLIYRTSFLNKYKVSLYDEYKGERRLLAEQEANWFIKTE